MIRGIRHPRLAIVTGAGSGIGRATSIAFADAGARVIAADINEVTAKETVKLVGDRGGRAHAYQLDVSDGVAWEEFASDIRLDHGVPDVVVNNAGVIMIGSFLDHTAKDWDQQMGVNLWGAIHGSRVFATQMAGLGQGGHIVNVASGAAYFPTGMYAAYATSKACVKMLSECMRVDLADKGIGVTVICPGVMNTNLAKYSEIRVDDEAEQIGRKAADVLLPMVGADPSHVARAIVRSVRYNWGVVPVRPESWVGWYIHRASPGLMRAIAGQVIRRDRIDLARRLVPRGVRDRLAS